MPDAHYPINFVVKDPAFLQRPALRRWKPADVTGLSPDRRQPFWKSKTDGGDQETANDDGGAERDRTADLMLAKHALSQLSYSPTYGRLRQRWWAWVESNYRPHPYQGCALTN